MIQPTQAQLKELSTVGKFWFRVADFCLRRLKPVLILWNRIYMSNFARLMSESRWVVDGAEHLACLTDQDKFVVIANHRSFFDFFIIGAFFYTRTKLSKHTIFPVRSSFFYDSLIGGLINAWMAGFFMFPPILRGKERREFNNYVHDRLVAELGAPGKIIGMHPEGTRGKGDDPYVIHKPKAGVGRLVLAAPNVRVLPVFIMGLSNSLWTEFKRTWFHREDHPIDIVFGAPIEFDDLRAKEQSISVVMEATQRAMKGVIELAEKHRGLAEQQNETHSTATPPC